MLTPDASALQSVRRRHELRVIETLVAHGTRTRRDLEADTKLSRTTLSTIVGDLRDRGVLAEIDPPTAVTGRNGRPTKHLSLNPSAGAAVGIELGRHRISVSLCGFNGSTVAHEQRSIPGTLGLDAKVQAAADIVKGMIADGRITPNAVGGVGVGIASRHADPRALADGAELQPDPRGASLAPLRQLLPAPLMWDNNIRLAAMNYGLDGEELLYVVLSAGISSAIVTQGKLLRGGNGIAGELGHMSVDFAGTPCWCGRRGCLESYLNEDNVLREAAHRGQAFPTVAELAKAAQAGDGIAGNIVDWAGELLARAIVDACVLLDPARVVIAGELSQFGDRLLAPSRRDLAAQQLGLGPRTTTVESAPYLPTAGSDGAARMALNHLILSDPA